MLDRLDLRATIAKKYVLLSAVLHMAVQKNIVLTDDRVGLLRPAILLFAFVTKKPPFSTGDNPTISSELHVRPMIIS